MPKLILCGASSISRINNFGDQLLRDIYAGWAVDADNRIDTEMILFDDRLKPTKSLDLLLKNADGLAYVGGGYFHEKSWFHNTKLIEYLMRHAWGYRNSRIYGPPYRTARKKALPVAVSGVEVGPLTNPFFRREVAKILKNSRMCTVRSRESYEYCRSYGVARPDLEVCVDAALTLRQETIPEIAKQEMAKVRGSGSAFRIGLHIHTMMKTENWDKNLFDLINQINEVFEDIKSKDENRVERKYYYIHDQSKGGALPGRSVDAERSLREILPTLISMPYQGDPWPLVGVIGGMDLIITTKLHVGIVARALGVPVLSIPTARNEVTSMDGRDKRQRFYRMIGEEWCYGLARNFIGEKFPCQLRQYFEEWHDGYRMHVNASAFNSAENNRALFQQFAREL